MAIPSFIPQGTLPPSYQNLRPETDLDALPTNLQGFYVWTVDGRQRYWKWIADGEKQTFTLERLVTLLRTAYGNEDPDLHYNGVYHPRIIFDRDNQQYVGAWRDPMRPGYKRTLAQLNQGPAQAYSDEYKRQRDNFTNIIDEAARLPTLTPVPEPEPLVITDLNLDLDL